MGISPGNVYPQKKHKTSSPTPFQQTNVLKKNRATLNYKYSLQKVYFIRNVETKVPFIKRILLKMRDQSYSSL